MAELNDGIHVRRYGAGPRAAVLLHGLLGSSSNWANLAPDLASRHPDYTFLCPDARNHGLSSHRDLHSYEEMASDVRMLLDREGARSAVLIGHSMGGMTAMVANHLFPERVCALAVLDFAPRAYASANRPILEAMARVGLEETSRRDIQSALLQEVDDERAVKLVGTNLKRDPSRSGCFFWRLNLPALLDFLDRMEQWAQPAGFGSEVPALFLRGEASPYVGTGDEALIRILFPESELQTISGAGHWLHADRPTEVANAISAHLSKMTNMN